jgi:hypothetical protein
MDYRNPELISLLRGDPVTENVTTEEKGAAETASDTTPETTAETTEVTTQCDVSADKGGLTAARGTANALMIGAILWAVVGLSLWFLLGH